MKTADYRNLIDACGQWRTSLLSAATSHEQRREAMTLESAVTELRSAYLRGACPHAQLADHERAARMLESCDDLLRRKRESFKAADANLQAMAFAGEWR